MCLLTNERYKTYQTVFSFGRLGHAQGVGLGGTVGGWGDKKLFVPNFNQIWCVSCLHQWHMQLYNFLGIRLLGPCGGAKRSNIIKSQLQRQFQRFLNKNLCVLSQMKDINHIRQDFNSFTWVMHAPGFGTVGGGGGLGGQKFNFLNMVMWHIKLKGMSSRPGYTENFFPRIKLVTLGWGQRIKYH